MNIINSNETELFKNLSQLELGNLYYDFHNDFNCLKLLFEDNILILSFKNIVNEYVISFKFDDSILKRFEFFNFKNFKDLTIDCLYRGRFQKDNELLEFDVDGRSYFYMEFCEDIKIEFWCKNIIIEKETNNRE